MNTLFIGRWQPLHGGHIRLIETALKRNEPVVVAIRDTKRDKNNPYSVKQREGMIKSAFGDKVKIITIPDVKKVCIGRDVGYEVVKLPYDVEKISGTKIRELENLFTVWFTGLSRAGKTTLALALRKKLKKRKIKARFFDGDFLRGTLWDDLSWSKKSRDENVERVIELCESGKRNNIVALISPYREMRREARRRLPGFLEVYVKCPLQVCKERDVNGLYKKAMRGEIPNFTGISDPYEEPEHPEVVCETDTESVDASLEKILRKLDTLFVEE